MSPAGVTAALRQVFTNEHFALLSVGQGVCAGTGGLEPNSACVFRPTNSEEVSRFLQIIKPFALNHEASFAIRDGGAQVPPDDEEFSNDVVILDLSSLKGIQSNPDGTVSIAAGEHWTSVYEKLDGEGLSVAGARNGGKGIGALALKGGLSFFSSSRGFVSDNSVNYQVVLVSGDIVQANAHVNADLWRSLKGGFVYYHSPNFSSQITLMVEELKRPNPSNTTHFILSSAYIAQLGQTICINRVYHTDGVEHAPELKPFTTVHPQVDGFGSLGLLSVQEAAADQAAGVKRRAHMDTTVKADAGILQVAVGIFTKAVEYIKPLDDNSLVACIVFEPLPVSLLRVSVSAFNQGSPFDLKPSEGPLVSISFVINWGNRSDDVKILTTFKAALDEIKQEATLRGLTAPFELMSTASHFQDPIGSYGIENKQKMQEVSKKYDPEGVFQKGAVNGFKLFASD